MFFILLSIDIISGLDPRRLMKEMLKTELEYRGVTYNLEDKKEKLVRSLAEELTKETLMDIQGMIANGFAI